MGRRPLAARCAASQWQVYPMVRRTASFNEGPLPAVKPTFECPRDGVDERQKMARTRKFDVDPARSSLDRHRISAADPQGTFDFLTSRRSTVAIADRN
jgi:hypothetical protein